MKTLITRLLALGCVSAALALPLKAVTVTVLTFGDSYSVGLVNDGIPSNPSDQVGYINTLIAQTLGSGPTLIGSEYYTRTNNTFGSLPTAVLTNYSKQDNSNTTFDLGTGFTYLVGKYDAANAGSYVWNVSGLTGTVTLPGTFSDGQYGLSHTTAFNPSSGPGPGPEVPDGGASVAMLGAVLCGIEALRRRFVA